MVLESKIQAECSSSSSHWLPATGSNYLDRSARPKTSHKSGNSHQTFLGPGIRDIPSDRTGPSVGCNDRVSPSDIGGVTPVWD